MRDKLQEIRISCGLSQSQLAKKSGVNVRLIQHYEQGTKKLYEASYSRVSALAKALDIKSEDLFMDT